METTYVETGPRGRYEETAIRLDGEPVGATAGIVYPGRKVVSLVLAAGGLVIFWNRGDAVQTLRVAVGKPLKGSAKGRAEVSGVRIGSARSRSTGTLAGFEPCETPAASYPDAARIETTSALRIKDRAMDRVVEILSEATSWHVSGLGVVASQERVRSYVDGVLQEDTGEVYSYLVSGTILGVPIP